MLVECLGIFCSILLFFVDLGVMIGVFCFEFVECVGKGFFVIVVGLYDIVFVVVVVFLLMLCFVYIFCGMWGLVGVELSVLVFMDVVCEVNFMYEFGVDG